LPWMGERRCLKNRDMRNRIMAIGKRHDSDSTP
jgi:hypothetical protein